jgi:hypothetical protein
MIDDIIKIVESVEGGSLSPLEGLVQLRKAKDVLEDAIKQIEEHAITELSNYDHKRAEIDGVKLELRSSAGRWDYSGVPYYESAKEALKRAEEKAKTAYNLVTKSGVLPVDGETGEVIAAAQYTQGRDTIFVSLVKK